MQLILIQLQIIIVTTTVLNNKQNKNQFKTRPGTYLTSWLPHMTITALNVVDLR